MMLLRVIFIINPSIALNCSSFYEKFRGGIFLRFTMNILIENGIFQKFLKWFHLYLPEICSEP